MVSEETSLSPKLSSSRTIFDTTCSTRSGSTGRLRNEIWIERASLSRSNGTRRPLRLITTSSRSCTRSKVVKRKLQARHTRRRRITAESSVGRESFTWVSRLAQLGQRIPSPFYAALSPVDGETRNQRLHLLAHGGFHQRIFFRALLRQHVENLGDQFAHVAEFCRAKAARRARRRAEPDAGGHHRLLRIERDAVFVAGDMSTPERRLGHLAGQA